MHSPHPAALTQIELADCFLVNIVIHTASSIDPALALNLVTALGKQKEASGEQTYFIHVSKVLTVASVTHNDSDLRTERVLSADGLAIGRDQGHGGVRNREATGGLLPYPKGNANI